MPPAQTKPSRLLERLLPAGVATAELTGAGDPALLLAGERHLVERAAPARARELAAGRACARRAAAQLGVVDCAIGARPDRRPDWPARLTGSITHTDGFTAAAVGDRRRFRAIGIDAERVGRVSPEIWDQVMVPEEVHWLLGLPRSVQAAGASLVFSAKEAFYKCQYEATQQWLEFRDVAVDFLAGRREPNSCALRPVRRVSLFDEGAGSAIVRYAFSRGLVLTAMTLPAH